jgi:hypothetical protein
MAVDAAVRRRCGVLGEVVVLGGDVAIQFTTRRLLLITLWVAVWAAAYGACRVYYWDLWSAPFPVRFAMGVAPFALCGAIFGRPRTGLIIGIIAGLLTGGMRVVDG